MREDRGSGHGPRLQEGLRASDKGRPCEGKGKQLPAGGGIKRGCCRGANTECTSRCWAPVEMSTKLSASTPNRSCAMLRHAACSRVGSAPSPLQHGGAHAHQDTPISPEASQRLPDLLKCGGGAGLGLEHPAVAPAWRSRAQLPPVSAGQCPSGRAEGGSAPAPLRPLCGRGEGGSSGSVVARGSHPVVQGMRAHEGDVRPSGLHGADGCELSANQQKSTDLRQRRS